MKKPNRNQFLIFAGIFAVTLAAYLIYQRAKKKAGEKKAESTSGGGSTTSKSGNIFSNFPLKKGSSGNLVKQLQQALIAQGGKLPKYGADGKFGSETEAALKSLYKVTVVDETTFNYITKLSGKAKSVASSSKNTPDYPINQEYANNLGLKFS
jgi:hypothetical protein